MGLHCGRRCQHAIHKAKKAIKKVAKHPVTKKLGNAVVQGAGMAVGSKLAVGIIGHTGGKLPRQSKTENLDKIVARAMRPPKDRKPKRINADTAVSLMQFYLAGAENAHAPLKKEIASLAKRANMSEEDVWVKVEAEARRLGFAGLK